MEAPGSCWTLVTEEDPGDVFSLSYTEEIVFEVSVEDVPETGALRSSEEEQPIDEQGPEDAATIEHLKGPDTDPRQTDEAAGTTLPKISEGIIEPITSTGAIQMAPHSPSPAASLIPTAPQKQQVPGPFQ